MARILVADDHADSRELFAIILRGAGHEVLCAADGEELVEVYRSERPDVALIDVFMPGKDGIEAIVDIRHEFPRAKLVAMSAGWNAPAGVATGSGTFDVLLDALAHGADATMSKPTEPATLLAAVDRVLTVPRDG